MVEVFKTNVHEATVAEMLIALLMHHLPGSKINFDMDDCDRILRIKEDDLLPANVISIVNKHGFSCSVLD